MNASLPHLRSLMLEFECLRDPPPAARIPGKLLEVLYANLKEAGLPQGTPSAFHLLDADASAACWPVAGQRYASELIVRTDDQATWEAYAAALGACSFRGNFRSHVGDFTDLELDDGPASAAPNELCLDFLTPLRFGRAAGDPPTALSPTVLLDLIERRMTRLCGRPWHFDRAPELTLLTHCWRYTEFWRRSASHQRRPARARHGTGIHYINGCTGPLYVRGDTRLLVPVLRLLERAHLAKGGGALAVGGHFRLHEEPRRFFDRWLLRSDRLAQVVSDHAAEHVPDDAWIQAGRNDGQDVHQHAARLVAELGACCYAPQPARIWHATKPHGGSRSIEQATTADAVVQQHLLRVLQPSLDRLQCDASHGFRPGRSVETVVRRVHAALHEGFTHVLRADIATFFASIDHAVLQERLEESLPRADVATRHAVRALLAAPGARPGEQPTPRTRGLAEGSPLSPLLSNLYLLPLDRAMERVDCRYLRYADDFVVLARTPEARDAAHQVAASVLDGLGLRLAPDKTRLTSLQAGFTFVGERFGGTDTQGSTSTVAPQRKPLVVLEPFTHLGINGDALEQRRDGRTLHTVPLRRVAELTILAPATLSTDLLARLARFRIPLAVALDTGYQVATLEPHSRTYFAISHHHASWFESLSDGDRRALAIRLVDRKVANYLTWAASRHRAGDADVVARLREVRARLPGAADHAALRGHEGTAARHVFRWLNDRIRADLRQHFTAPRREQRAPDRLNSLLSFGYYLLFARLNGLLRAHGLNPYLGLLHDGEDRYETLVADLQEPFRVHVDRLVLRLINTGVVGPGEFSRSGNRVRLTRPAARRFVDAFEAMLAGSPGGLCIRDALTVQVRALRATVTQGAPLWLYGWELPQPLAFGADGTAGEEARDGHASARR
jgi:CRISPR-associated protein Cas1